MEIIFSYKSKEFINAKRHLMSLYLALRCVRPYKLHYFLQYLTNDPFSQKEKHRQADIYSKQFSIPIWRINRQKICRPIARHMLYLICRGARGEICRKTQLFSHFLFAANARNTTICAYIITVCVILFTHRSCRNCLLKVDRRIFAVN